MCQVLTNEQTYSIFRLYSNKFDVQCTYPKYSIFLMAWRLHNCVRIPTQPLMLTWANLSVSVIATHRVVTRVKRSKGETLLLHGAPLVQRWDENVMNKQISQLLFSVYGIQTI